eukprot:6199320-Pleurochrysis_carterae.AAC.1
MPKTDGLSPVTSSKERLRAARGRGSAIEGIDGVLYSIVPVDGWSGGSHEELARVVGVQSPDEPFGLRFAVVEHGRKRGDVTPHTRRYFRLGPHGIGCLAARVVVDEH